MPEQKRMSRYAYLVNKVAGQTLCGVFYGKYVEASDQAVSTCMAWFKIVVITKRVSAREWQEKGATVVTFRALTRGTAPKAVECDLLYVRDFNPNTSQCWLPMLEGYKRTRTWVQIGHCNFEDYGPYVMKKHLFGDFSYVPFVGYGSDVLALPETDEILEYNTSPFERFVHAMQRLNSKGESVWTHLGPDVAFAEMSIDAFNAVRESSPSPMSVCMMDKTAVPQSLSEMVADYDWDHNEALRETPYVSSACAAMSRLTSSDPSLVVAVHEPKLQKYLEQFTGAKVVTYGKMLDSRMVPKRVVIFQAHPINGCKSGRKLMHMWRSMPGKPKITVIKPRQEWSAYYCNPLKCVGL
ncbi:hypothetical protein 50R [Ranavirus ambystoma1]|uniref:RGV 9807-like protein n=1 Tax=Ranavirus ambystoma1 TaxID=265294 RepID=A0A0U2RS75_9VIRU|nr:hypothetical protein 50R [Ambystoma tigrinum virus]ALN37352.1 hypothetical protein 51R [Ambystoma tigrinum virus]ALN37447.1 hypothetical protein 44R [Ambystoma tigrinum virus]ALN37546.1 hypothetical protein 44R [Ambystoma tigrinum virus]ALN37852.1 hypothetical protein 49R [Ambystoma tigrinum virus]